MSERCVFLVLLIAFALVFFLGAVFMSLALASLVAQVKELFVARNETIAALTAKVTDLSAQLIAVQANAVDPEDVVAAKDLSATVAEERAK